LPPPARSARSKQPTRRALAAEVGRLNRERVALMIRLEAIAARAVAAARRPR
jgi:hypothetical protein